jgi:hypothetical protein
MLVYQGLPSLVLILPAALLLLLSTLAAVWPPGDEPHHLQKQRRVLRVLALLFAAPVLVLHLLWERRRERAVVLQVLMGLVLLAVAVAAPAWVASPGIIEETASLGGMVVGVGCAALVATRVQERPELRSAAGLGAALMAVSIGASGVSNAEIILFETVPHIAADLKLSFWENRTALAAERLYAETLRGLFLGAFAVLGFASLPTQARAGSAAVLTVLTLPLAVHYLVDIRPLGARLMIPYVVKEAAGGSAEAAPIEDSPDEREDGASTPESEPENLDPDLAFVQPLIKRRMNQIRYCYERELAKRPSIGGEIVVEIVVSIDGTVSSATTSSSTMDNTAVETCINNRLVRLQFPAPEDGLPLTVAYPFHFSGDLGSQSSSTPL